jgi:hypothetical protein
MKKRMRYFMILVSFIPSLLRAAEPGAAAKHFENYLSDCGTNEIRCVWFSWDEPNLAAEMMTLDLQDRTVHTARKLKGSELQGAETRKLTFQQIAILKRLHRHLPQSDENVAFDQAVSVSVCRDGKVQIFHYQLRRAPDIIQRIYDIGGGFFFDKDA